MFLNIQHFCSISYEQVKDVAELLDQKWREREDISFYSLEEYYSKKWQGSIRVYLMKICRYLVLCGYYDEEFWKNFLKDSPTEANSIDQKTLNIEKELQQTIRILES